MTVTMVPCPNGGRCGSRTHDLKSLQYASCNNVAGANSRPATPSPAVSGKPTSSRGASSSDSPFARLTELDDQHKRLSQASYEARKAEIISAAEITRLVAREICPKITEISWVDNPESQCANLHASCGCGAADDYMEGEAGAAWEDFTEAHQETASRKVSDSMSLEDYAEDTLDTGAVDTFRNHMGLERWRGDGFAKDDRYVDSFRDEHLAKIGFTMDNPEARAYVINAAEDWWNLSEDSDVAQSARTMFPSRER